jgi:hypothetical protein
MAAVPPIRRKKPGSEKSTPRRITFELDHVEGELIPHRLISGKEILTYMKSKRAGKPAKPCCAYCHRAFTVLPPKPLTETRIKELNRRSEKTLGRSTAFMRDAIEKLRRTDVLKQQPTKSDEEYLAEIFAAMKKSA